jgi:hypothetical protein
MKRAWDTWNPLEEPTAYVADLKRWRKAFRMPKESSDDDNLQIDSYGNAAMVNGGEGR